MIECARSLMGETWHTLSAAAFNLAALLLPATGLHLLRRIMVQGFNETDYLLYTGPMFDL